MKRSQTLAVALVLAASSVGGATRAPVARAGSGAAISGLALERAMRSRKLVDVKFEDKPLEDVVQWLRIATGWNFVIRKQVVEKAGIDLAAVRAKVEVSNVSVATLLGIVLEPHALVAKIEGNVIFITTKADAMGKPVLVLHPISQLTWTITDFHGPDIDLHPSGYTPPDDQPEETTRDDDPFTDPQHIVDLLKQMVDAPWDTEGWSISATKVYLAVKAPRSVQRQVAVAIAQMSSLK